MQRMKKYCPHCGELRHYHTKKWYMKEFRVNPERLSDIEILKMKNPHYSSASPMVLYAECQVKIELEKHPDLIIKQRTEKQITTSKEIGQKLGEYSRIKGEINHNCRRMHDDINHFNWHLENGNHKHNMEEWDKQLEIDIEKTKQNIDGLNQRKDKIFANKQPNNK